MRRVFIVLAATSLFWPSALWIVAQPAADAAHALGFGVGLLQRPAPGAEPQVPEGTFAPEAPQLLQPGDPGWDTDDERLESSAATPTIRGDERRATSRPVQRRSVNRGGSQKGALVPSASKQLVPKTSKQLVPKKGLRVSAATVLRLANARAVPQGAYQSPTNQHPGGMLLQGVSAMGVGLQDGDILSHVAGAPANSRSAVVSAVLAARAKRAQAISATFWRNGEPWRLIVEMPYLRGPRTVAASASATSGGASAGAVSNNGAVSNGAVVGRSGQVTLQSPGSRAIDVAEPARAN